MLSATVCTLCNHAWSVPEERRGGRFNSYARTRLAARTVLYLLTHISARPAVFLLPLPLSPSHSAAPILSRDIKWPPRHLCSLLLISGHIYICLASRLLRIVRITRAKICARSRNSITFINVASLATSSSGWESVATLIRDSRSYKPLKPTILHSSFRLN